MILHCSDSLLLSCLACGKGEVIDVGPPFAVLAEEDRLMLRDEDKQSLFDTKCFFMHSCVNSSFHSSAL